MPLAELRQRADACIARWPRWLWWSLGAAIACTGAVTARLIADQLPADARVPVWLAGGGLIFLGLAVLSLGSRSRPVPVADEVADAATGTDGGAGDNSSGNARPAPPPMSDPATDPVAAEVALATRMVEQLTAKEEGKNPPGTPLARQRLADDRTAGGGAAGGLWGGGAGEGNRTLA